MEKVTTICCAAGKSGGHIIPNLQWAAESYPGAQILYYSADSPLDMKLLSGKTTWHVPLSMRMPRWYQAPFFIIQCVYTMGVSAYYLYKHKPEVILSTGGITAIPVCIAGWLLRIPIKLFELNATPGMATRWLAPLATTINVCFKSAQKFFDSKKVSLKPYPLRPCEQSNHGSIFADSDRTVIFIQGGSQGSVSLNKKVKAWIEDNPEVCRNSALIHQTGSADRFDWHAFYRKHGIPAHVFDFDTHLSAYYQAADFIICRAGAGQLFEAVQFQKKCIVVPLELATNTHQLENAIAMQAEYPHLFTVTRQHEAIALP